MNYFKDSEKNYNDGKFAHYWVVAAILVSFSSSNVYSHIKHLVVWQIATHIQRKVICMSGLFFWVQLYFSAFFYELKIKIFSPCVENLTAYLVDFGHIKCCSSLKNKFVQFVDSKNLLNYLKSSPSFISIFIKQATSAMQTVKYGEGNHEIWYLWLLNDFQGSFTCALVSPVCDI